MRPLIVVGPQPPSRVELDLLDVLKQVLAKPIVSHRPVVALDVCVLLGLAGLDVLELYTFLLGPDLQPVADVLRAVVAPHDLRPATPLHDLLQGADRNHPTQSGSAR